jgi:transposase
MVSTIVGGHYLGLSMAKKRRKRRHWDDDEKREIAAQTRVPGVSVSRVARRYDVNANLVFKWLRDARFAVADDDEPGASFLPVEIIAEAKPVPVGTTPTETSIEINLANGHCLSIKGVFDLDAVARLARSLAA